MSDSLLAELMTSAQVAELLQMKRTTIEDYARRGLLPSLKLGRHRRFVGSHVEAALAQLRATRTRMVPGGATEGYSRRTTSRPVGGQAATHGSSATVMLGPGVRRRSSQT